MYCLLPIDLNKALTKGGWMSKFKAFAYNKLNGAKIMISFFDRVENIVGKDENAGFQHSVPFR